MKMQGNFLEIRNLTIRFYTYKSIVRVIEGFNLSIKQGSTLGVVGESGCGKSVTALSIMGLIPSPPGEITSGEIWLEGEDLCRKSEEQMRQLRGKKISMIFQDPMTSLNPVFTIGDQILTVIQTHEKFNRGAAISRAIEMLTRVGLPEPSTLLKKYPHELSGGMCQRVMIAMALACNPRYAGVYYYGRHRSRKNVDGSTTYFKAPQDEWLVLIKDAHPAYITWDQYEENTRRIRQNAIAYNNIDRKTPAREGPCLLQGLAVCGKCGQRMTIRYKYRHKGRIDPAYLCQRNRIERYEDSCQYIPGAGVDEAISKLIIDSVTPLALEVALEVQQELELRFNEADKLRRQQVERVEYEANLARRRFMQVDPDHRLVADTLEAEWNEKLRHLQEAQNYYQEHRQLDSIKLKEEQKKKVLKLARDFPKLWKNPKTPPREKKRMIRFLVEDVTMIKGENITLHVRFKGGVEKTLKIPLPAKGWQHALTDPQIVEMVDELLNNHNYSEIAAILNERGYKSGSGLRFDRRIVTGIRRSYNLKTRYARLRNTGKLTAEEVANLLGVSIRKVRRWGKEEIIKTYPYNDRNGCLYEHPGVNSPLMRKRA